jgi:hypothetical protein
MSLTRPDSVKLVVVDRFDQEEGTFWEVAITDALRKEAEERPMQDQP